MSSLTKQLSNRWHSLGSLIVFLTLLFITISGVYAQWQFELQLPYGMKELVVKLEVSQGSVHHTSAELATHSLQLQKELQNSLKQQEGRACIIAQVGERRDQYEEKYSEVQFVYDPQAKMQGEVVEGRYFTAAEQAKSEDDSSNIPILVLENTVYADCFRANPTKATVQFGGKQCEIIGLVRKAPSLFQVTGMISEPYIIAPFARLGGTITSIAVEDAKGEFLTMFNQFKDVHSDFYTLDKKVMKEERFSILSTLSEKVRKLQTALFAQVMLSLLFSGIVLLCFESYKINERYKTFYLCGASTGQVLLREVFDIAVLVLIAVGVALGLTRINLSFMRLSMFPLAYLIVPCVIAVFAYLALALGSTWLIIKSSQKRMWGK